MSFIDPHIHMISRVTEDYEKLALAGCVAVTEPAFWAGFDRSSPKAFSDYFHCLTSLEPKRAAQFGIQHYSWLCINPKEAEDLEFSRAVMDLIPEFINRPNVLGIGEIGLNKVSRNELVIFREQVELARRYQQLIMIHTPHLEDKLKGTLTLIEVLQEMKVEPNRVIIDHVEEHTVGKVLDSGFWAGITLYPDSKCSIPRAVDIVERFGTERLMVNSAADWGASDPLAVPRFRLEMRLRGHPTHAIQTVSYQNPKRFLSGSKNFKLPEE
jgi:predicted metal-dependent TIM-barrel fold hydrolase